jgi:Leucine-rich repeat (LRR) protein
MISSLNFISNPFLQSVTYLDLAGNAITAIETDTFKILVKIKEIDLSNNPIHSIEAKSFLNPDLQYFYINQLHLDSNHSVFDLIWVNSKVSKLDLSNNPLMSLKLKIMSELDELKLRNVSLNSLLNLSLSTYFPKINLLDLSQNDLSALNQVFFSTFTKLTTLNLSRTGLASLDSIKLDSIKYLNVLDLSFNRIEFISKSQMSNFKVNYLYLSNNRVRFVETGAFKLCVTLEMLDMSHNQIVELDLDDLYRISPSVKTILYNDNLIQKVRPLTSRPGFNTALLKLDLSNNCIASLDLSNIASDMDVTSDDPFLQVRISLSRNKLTRIGYTLFNSFRNLVFLNVEWNEIEYIEPYSFYNLNILETLILSNNQIRDLDTQALDGLSQVVTLNLSHNYLETVNLGLFSDLYNLKTLDMSNNSLRTIADDSFAKLISLKNLNVQFNYNLNLTNRSMAGMRSIQNVFISFSILTNFTTNVLFLKESLIATFEKMVMGNIAYYKSINLLYEESGVTRDCAMTLFFIKHRVHLNLKTGLNLDDFMKQCTMFDLKIFN